MSVALALADDPPDGGNDAEGQDERRLEPPRSHRQRRKGDLFDLVTQLHARRFQTEFIAAALGITARRVRQIVTLLRLEPPHFDTLAEALTWLAKEAPAVELRLRYFRNGNESPA